MLQIEMDVDAIVDAQNRYLGSGLGRGVKAAAKVMKVRQTFSVLFQRFNERQISMRDGRRPYFEHGREAFLRSRRDGGDDLPPPYHGFILDGLSDFQKILPSKACRAGGPNIDSLDPPTYLAQFAEGGRIREWPDMTSLALYANGLNRLRIVWIGLKEDVSAKRSDLAIQTSGWTDLATVYADYASWLEGECRAARP